MRGCSKVWSPDESREGPYPRAKIMFVLFPHPALWIVRLAVWFRPQMNANTIQHDSIYPLQAELNVKFCTLFICHRIQNLISRNSSIRTSRTKHDMYRIRLYTYTVPRPSMHGLFTYIVPLTYVLFKEHAHLNITPSDRQIFQSHELLLESRTVLHGVKCPCVCVCVICSFFVCFSRPQRVVAFTRTASS